MQVDGVERNRAQEVNACHDHTRNPEEDDVVARLHNGGGIVVQQVGSDFGPTKGAERPQP